jgi:hypothetical protein
MIKLKIGAALLAAGALAGVTFAAPARAELLTHKDLTAEMAISMAQAAIAACKAQNYSVSPPWSAAPAR